jgi:branched-subunit amino acid transport protein
MSWLPVLAAAGLVTFATRLSFIALLGRVETPPLLSRALRYVAPAVLSAIVFQELLVRGGTVHVGLGNARLGAGLLAAAVAWRTRNVLLTIAAGMCALWVLQAVLSR